MLQRTMLLSMPFVSLGVWRRPRSCSRRCARPASNQRPQRTAASFRGVKGSATGRSPSNFSTSHRIWACHPMARASTQPFELAPLTAKCKKLHESWCDVRVFMIITECITHCHEPRQSPTRACTGALQCLMKQFRIADIRCHFMVFIFVVAVVIIVLFSVVQIGSDN